MTVNIFILYLWFLDGKYIFIKNKKINKKEGKSGKFMAAETKINRLAKTTTLNKTNIADIQEELRQTMCINLQINSKLEEISYWRQLASKAESVFYSETAGGSGNKKRSKVEDCVCKIADIENSLKEDMDKLCKLKERMSHTIEQVKEPECRSLLIHRYLCGKKWEKVAEDMGYSYVHVVHRLHPKALKKISEINLLN